MDFCGYQPSLGEGTEFWLGLIPRYDFFLTLLFFFAGRVRTGFFPLPFFLVAAEAPRSAMILEPMGEPRPVQASQPGLAENAPLFPETMSWNADAAFAA